MWKVVDLTFTIRDHWRWPVKLTAMPAKDRNFFLRWFMYLKVHCFTQVDAPLHFLPDGLSIEKVPLEKLMGEAAIVNLSHLGENTGVSAAELEKHGQHIREGDIALIRTDWPLKCDYMTKDFWGKAPYMERDACEWLVGRKIKAWGGDFPCDYLLRNDVIDPQRTINAKLEENTTHDVFFKEGAEMDKEYRRKTTFKPTKFKQFLPQQPRGQMPRFPSYLLPVVWSANLNDEQVWGNPFPAGGQP